MRPVPGAEKNRCNEKAGEDKEDVDTNPAKLGQLSGKSRKAGVVAPQNKKNGHGPQAVEFRNSPHNYSLLSCSVENRITAGALACWTNK